MIIRIPAGVGVRDIRLRRARAEVTEVEISYRASRHDRWVYDGSGYVPDHPGARRYRIRNPEAFRARDGGFEILVTCRWRQGDGVYNSCPRATQRYEIDRQRIFFYTGARDPDANTTVTLIYDREVSSQTGIEAAWIDDHDIAALEDADELA